MGEAIYGQKRSDDAVEGWVGVRGWGGFSPI